MKTTKNRLPDFFGFLVSGFHEDYQKQRSEARPEVPDAGSARNFDFKKAFLSDFRFPVSGFHEDYQKQAPRIFSIFGFQFSVPTKTTKNSVRNLSDFRFPVSMKTT